MKERTQIAIKLIVSHIGLIIGLTLVSFLIRNDFLFLSISQTVLLITYFTGYWEFFGLSFKRIFCFAMQLILIVIVAYKWLNGFSEDINLYWLVVLTIIQLYLLVELIKVIIVMVKKDDQYMEIAFPFRNGTFLITDGGNSRISRLMNYHYYSPIHKKNNTNLSMLFATDIVRLDRHKWLPTRNEEYPTYGEGVYSPMDGQVVDIVNGIPDNEPFSGNYPYNAGNTVVIRKDDYYLLLGHLKKDSIAVKVGDAVHANDLVASVGSSGWCERPHIHMQLIKSDSAKYWSGIGIEMRYNNRTLTKNALIRN